MIAKNIRIELLKITLYPLYLVGKILARLRSMSK